MSSTIYNESFVLYESVYKTFERLYHRNKAIAADYIKAVMDFGITGVLPDEEEEVWLYGLDSAIASIDSAKNNRRKNIEDGSKGGRPQIELDRDEVMQKKDELRTWKAVAAYFHISENTLRAIRKQWEAEDATEEKTAKTSKTNAKTQKLKNLNVNVNENDNENENANENDNDNADDTISDSFLSSVNLYMAKGYTEEEARIKARTDALM